MSTDPSLLVYLPVSIGEAVDKWNILHIKKDHVKDESRLHFVQQEIEALGPNLKLILSKPSMSKLYQYLDYFNRKIWILCDVLRVADVNTYNTYDEAYAKNCVDIIKYNDARFRVKNQMNLVAISSLREQKNFAGTKIVIWFPQTIEYHRAMVGLVRYFSFCYDNNISFRFRFSINASYTRNIFIGVINLKIISQSFNYMLNTLFSLFFYFSGIILFGFCFSSEFNNSPF